MTGKEKSESRHEPEVFKDQVLSVEKVDGYQDLWEVWFRPSHGFGSRGLSFSMRVEGAAIPDDVQLHPTNYVCVTRMDEDTNVGYFAGFEIIEDK